MHLRHTHIVDRCEMLVRGFVRVGIIALVDEATGFRGYLAYPGCPVTIPAMKIGMMPIACAIALLRGAAQQTNTPPSSRKFCSVPP
jgi:hypothetical protein